jgi:hypothetical protein
MEGLTKLPDGLSAQDAANLVWEFIRVEWFSEKAIEA